jgi:hypothetical protein
MAKRLEATVKASTATAKCIGCKKRRPSSTKDSGCRPGEPTLNRSDQKSEQEAIGRWYWDPAIGLGASRGCAWLRETVSGSFTAIKVSIDTFVQLLHFCSSGLITTSALRPGWREPMGRIVVAAPSLNRASTAPHGCGNLVTQIMRKMRGKRPGGGETSTRPESVISDPEPPPRSARPEVVPQSQTVRPGSNSMTHRAVEPDAPSSVPGGCFGRFQG